MFRNARQARMFLIDTMTMGMRLLIPTLRLNILELEIYMPQHYNL